jgi:hypothetical protein
MLECKDRLFHTTAVCYTPMPLPTPAERARLNGQEPMAELVDDGQGRSPAGERSRSGARC